MSDKYDEKALEYFEATWVKENRKGRVEHLAAFGRECAAHVYQDEAKNYRDASKKYRGSVRAKLFDAMAMLFDHKAAALRQPISVTQEEEGK